MVPVNEAGPFEGPSQNRLEPMNLDPVTLGPRDDVCRWETDLDQVQGHPTDDKS